jgi:predicted kinase
MAPRLICVGGLSGTGKSTLSGRLAGELGAVEEATKAPEV